MKIQLLSDLHLEFDPPELPIISQEADVIIYAGDVSSRKDLALDYFKNVRKETEAKILYVLGNHEFYGKFLHSGSVYKHILREVPNLDVLDRDALLYQGVRFIGCTLWTDFDDRRSESAARLGMSDYVKIRKMGKYYNTEYIDTVDILNEHYKCRDFLREEFYHASFSSYPVVVITHHSPSFYCVPEGRRGHPMNGAFYVELSDLMIAHKPALWLYGHTHEVHRTTIGDTELLCNSWGYPFESHRNMSPVIVGVSNVSAKDK